MQYYVFQKHVHMVHIVSCNVQPTMKTLLFKLHIIYISHGNANLNSLPVIIIPFDVYSTRNACFLTSTWYRNFCYWLVGGHSATGIASTSICNDCVSSFKISISSQWYESPRCDPAVPSMGCASVHVGCQLK
jgi:hypothetical protein